MLNQIFAGIIVVHAIGTGLVAYVLYRKKKSKLLRCYRAWGEVVAIEEKQGSEGGLIKHPVIRYKAMNGELVTFRSNYGSSSWKVAVGDRLEIWADPNQPSDAEVVGLMSQWMLPLFLGVGSLIGLVMAPVAFFFFR